MGLEIYTCGHSYRTTLPGKHHHHHNCPICIRLGVPSPAKSSDTRDLPGGLVIIFGAIITIALAICMRGALLSIVLTPFFWAKAALLPLLRFAGTQLTLLWWDVRKTFGLIWETLGLLWALLWALLRTAFRFVILSAALYYILPATRFLTRWFQRDGARRAREREEEALRRRAEAVFEAFRRNGYGQHQQQQHYHHYQEDEYDSDEPPELVHDDAGAWDWQQRTQGSTPRREPARAQTGGNNKKKNKKRGRR